MPDTNPSRGTASLGTGRPVQSHVMETVFLSGVPAWSSFLEKAVPGNRIPGEALLISPKGARFIQPTASLTSSCRPGIDAWNNVVFEQEVISRKVSVEVGTLGQWQPVSCQDRSWKERVNRDSLGYLVVLLSVGRGAGTRTCTGWTGWSATGWTGWKGTAIGRGAKAG